MVERMDLFGRDNAEWKSVEIFAGIKPHFRIARFGNYWNGCCHSRPLLNVRLFGERSECFLTRILTRERARRVFYNGVLKKMIKGDIHFYSKYSSLTSIPLTSRFLFPLSRFHDIFRKIRNRKNAFFFFYIIFKDLNGIANFYSCSTRMQINRWL